MSKLYHKILKFLPIIIIVSVLIAPAPANAGLSDWAEKMWDTATEIGKAALNTVKECTGGAAACKKAAIESAQNVASSALGLTPGKDCPVPIADSPCMFCPMFRILYMASSGVAKASYDIFHSDLGKLILIFLAVSLALIILKNVASMGAKDPGSILNEVFTKAFICAAVYIIVTQDYFNVLNATIAPIIKDGLAFVGLGDGVGGIDSMMKCLRSSFSAGGFSMTMGAMSGAVLPTDIGNMIYCAIDNIEQKIHKLFSFGQYAFCLGTGPNRLFLVLPHPVYIIDGLFLYIGGLFFLVAYPWVMADAVLQMGIAFAFLPFAITGYAFNGTKKYLSKTFQWILHSLFVFIFMAILINCVLGYVAKLLGLIFDTTGNSEILFTDPNQGIAFYGPNMIKIIFILAIGWVYMPVVRDLAGNFSKGSPLSAASKVGNEVNAAMEKNAGKVADFAGGMAVQGASATARGAVSFGRNYMRHKLMKMTDEHGHMSGGNKTFTVGGRYMPKWLTRGLEFKVEDDGHGNQVLRREFTSITGRKHVMVSDEYSTIKQEYTKSGNQIKNKVTFKSGFIRKHLMNAKGEVNVGALHAVLNSPLGQNPAYRQAIMEQLSMEVLKSKGKNVGTYYKSRTVTFNAADPTKISIEQVDHSGRTTKFSLDVNDKTGQAAVSYATTTGKSKKDYEIYFNNGMVEMETKGKRDGGTILYETTKFNYSATAQKGHDSILEADDSNQVVDKTGAIASNLQKTVGTPPKDNPNYLLHGMDSIAGVTSIGSQTMDDFVLHDILKRGRVNGTNKFNTSIGNYFI